MQWSKWNRKVGLNIKVVELFGGIGAIRKALINIDIPHEIIDYVEIDKNCVKSYNALYEENYIPKSVVGYTLPDEKIDLLIHGSPCQDFSSIGTKKGGAKGSGTRSSLLFETIEIIKKAKYKPTWVIWENVKGVLNRNMKDSFFLYLEEMQKIGYETKYEILNSLDFGIPQKRERIFAISYLGKNKFNFNSLNKKQSPNINEFLEKEFDEKYIVKQPSILRFFTDPCYKPEFQRKVNIIDEYCYTILTKQMRVPNAGFIEIGNKEYRYLTEKECFKLMGFTDEDFKKIRSIYPIRENKMSLILYKQAGNSIVVNVLEEILKEIIKHK